MKTCKICDKRIWLWQGWCIASIPNIKESPLKDIHKKCFKEKYTERYHHFFKD